MKEHNSTLTVLVSFMKQYLLLLTHETFFNQYLYYCGGPTNT